ncbi:hypothetical protein EON64_14170 [archaeon]|nr:MAG: hypothetical protein EON64_14170 [archaeon]
MALFFYLKSVNHNWCTFKSSKSIAMGATQSNGGDSAAYSPPLSPSEPPSPQASPKRRSSLRASFFWSTPIAPLVDAEPEPLPPAIEITRLDVPRNENHPYQSYRVSRKIGQ